MARLESEEGGGEQEEQEVHEMGLQDLQAFVEGQEQEQEQEEEEGEQGNGMEENKMAE